MSWENILKYSTRDMMRDEREDDDLRHSRRKEAEAEYELQTSGEHGVDEHGNYVPDVYDKITSIEREYGLDFILEYIAIKKTSENKDVVSLLQQKIKELK